MFVWDAGPLAVDGSRYIINFPTKKHWRSNSKLSDIRTGLDDLVRQVKDLSIKRVAIPPLGCGLGGLPWEHVRPLIERAFEEVPDVTVLLYPPEDAPASLTSPSGPG
jgi:O-acetyl-ADP-ribose deacetylase (regulator of RNase III)